MRRLRRLKGALGTATVQLRRRPSRTALAIIGVALAVLATTLLASVGLGVLETGQQTFDAAERDLWVTGGPIRIAPQSTTPLENTVLDSHAVATAIERRDDVRNATPIAFQGMYVGRNASDLQLLTGVGFTGNLGDDNLDAGEGFTQGDLHYANGSYDGPMTREVIIDPQTAATFDVDVGEPLYIGASRADARDRAFTVVGISSRFSRFLGTPTVIVRLSELQELTGTTGADRATFVTVRLEPGADTATVRADLEERYPDYEIRTNREQLQAVLRNNALVFASASVFVALAVLAGLVLTVNLTVLVVEQQRQELAALRAIGLSRGTLVSIVGTHGLLLGLVGGLAGLALTPLGVRLLNGVANRLVGFGDLLHTPPVVYLVGAGIAVAIGTVSAVVAGWLAARSSPLNDLEQ